MIKDDILKKGGFGEAVGMCMNTRCVRRAFGNSLAAAPEIIRDDAFENDQQESPQ